MFLTYPLSNVLLVLLAVAGNTFYFHNAVRFVVYLAGLVLRKELFELTAIFIYFVLFFIYLFFTFFNFIYLFFL
jgi:hypothetical protein